MPVQGISTTALAAAGIGALVLWSALKGASVTSGFRSLLGGNTPSGANTEPITGSPPGGDSSGGGSFTGTTGSAIANQGLHYVGSGSVYRWGGGSPSGWDCSGFVNYVVGHDLRQAIPGSPSGNYSGHGPATPQWGLFGTSIPRSQVQAGDLVVWPLRHMGIAISNSQMVNCPGPNGSPAPVIGNIDINLGVVTYRRISSTATPAPAAASGPGLNNIPIIAPNGTNINDPNPVIPVFG